MYVCKTVLSIFHLYISVTEEYIHRCLVSHLPMRDKLFHHLFQRILIVHDHLAQPWVFPVTGCRGEGENSQKTSHNTFQRIVLLIALAVPGPVCHFMGVVVESNDCFPLFNTGQ